MREPPWLQRQGDQQHPSTVKSMLHLQTSDFEPSSVAPRNPSETEGLPGGWWIVPSAILGLAGWIGIFYGLGLI